MGKKCCRRLLKDSGPAGSVLADLMMQGAKPSFKEPAMLGITCPQACTWTSSRRELELGNATVPKVNSMEWQCLFVSLVLWNNLTGVPKSTDYSSEGLEGYFSEFHWQDGFLGSFCAYFTFLVSYCCRSLGCYFIHFFTCFPHVTVGLSDSICDIKDSRLEGILFKIQIFFLFFFFNWEFEDLPFWWVRDSDLEKGRKVYVGLREGEVFCSPCPPSSLKLELCC